MKTVLFAVAGIAMAAGIGWASVAWAACPLGTSYQCTQGFNGKVICGCR